MARDRANVHRNNMLGAISPKIAGAGSRPIALSCHELTVMTYPYDGLHPATFVSYRNQPCRSSRDACLPLGVVPTDPPTRQGSTCPRLTPSGERPPPSPTGATSSPSSRAALRTSTRS
ncbi:hypothetical protein FRACA_440019 [Frankia canadensis]|uniref:Uncharacterized protein n=1 Tax=Frankia canadensis TaxID=1836972 RepID=A0A2I2KXD5_9ACTN|nr:hypothetical protein FRACA_440019 [Frankia canadensis]SOU57612.1 hypothetical protein FRACA_440019 [Frankia canadensis]